MLNLQEIREIKQLKSLDIIAKSIVEGFIAGLHKSPYHGFSLEFSEHRPYNRGESIRFIDWKLYARTEKLYVKKFEQETNLRSYIVLDTSSSMLFPVDSGHANKLEFAVYVAAALIFLLQRQRDASGLITFSQQIDLFLPSKLKELHKNLLLSKLQELLDNQAGLKQRKTKISPVIHELAERLPKRSLVMIFSDFLVDEDLDELIAALEHMRYNKNELILFHLYDQTLEINFEFDDRPFKFVDIETGEVIKLHPNSIRDSYQQRISEYFNALKLRCGQLNIDFVECDVNKDFVQVLVAYLLKRQKLF